MGGDSFDFSFLIIGFKLNSEVAELHISASRMDFWGEVTVIVRVLNHQGNINKTKRGKHMGQNNDTVIYNYADKFINLANEMAKSDMSGNVGVALRFAAA